MRVGSHRPAHACGEWRRGSSPLARGCPHRRPAHHRSDRLGGEHSRVGAHRAGRRRLYPKAGRAAVIGCARAGRAASRGWPMTSSAAPVETPQSHGLLEQDIDRELRSFLAKQLAAEGGASELAHVAMAIVATLIVWQSVPHRQALLWLNALVIAALGRAAFRRIVNTPDASPARILGAIRRGVGAVGLAWGAGVILIGPQLPLETLAWITVMFAGLVAGANVTLLADPVSYYIISTTMLIPLGIALGIHGRTGSHVVGIFLTATFGVAMAIFYRRSHAALLQQYRVAKRLELTERAASEAREAAQR